MMKTRTMLTIGLSAFAFTGLAAGVAAPGMVAVASSAENPKRAASEAANARKALARRQAAKAVTHAEAAVAHAPQAAEYRALLGQAYLLAGRFVSARQALTDALTLDPSNGRVALNLALAEIARGDWAGARNTLETHADTIPASDRGLAFALAGDPVKAVDILAPASREADATPKTRQNFALALALAGRWQEAKAIAAIDVAPDQLDARIMQWAAFSRPTNAYDQVASLLGVRPIEDAGQPVRLALARPGQPAALAAVAPAADPVDEYMPGVPDNAAEVAADMGVAVAAEASAWAEPAQVAGTGPQVVFGPREEIVQTIPAMRPAPVPAPVAVATAWEPAAAPTAKGGYYVQLGAYGSAAVARDSWRRVAQRVPAVARYSPQGARVATRAGNFYRLSVGGFARADADALCRTVKASGGTCFVRAAAGDQLADWAGGGTRLAAR